MAVVLDLKDTIILKLEKHLNILILEKILVISINQLLGTLTRVTYVVSYEKSYGKIPFE